MRASPLPVSMALAGHTNARDCRKVSAISRMAQVTMATDLGHADLEVQPDLAQHVDGDDHCRHVQPRIPDARQDER